MTQNITLMTRILDTGKITYAPVQDPGALTQGEIWLRW